MIKESDLNEKQIIFCKEYLVSMNATESAIKAGYSKKTAYSQGCRLLKDVRIKTFIDEQLYERASKLDITPNRILEELGHIAFFDISNIYDGISLKEIDSLPENITRAISGIKSRMEKSEGENVAEIVEIKSNDKLKALEMLMKHLGMFTEKIVADVTTQNTNTIIQVIEDKQE